MDEMDTFYVIPLDSLVNGTANALTVYPGGGQTIGLLFYSENAAAALDYDELFWDDEIIQMFPTANFGWELEQHDIYYWFASYAVDRNAAEGSHTIQYFVDDDNVEEPTTFTVTFEFGNILGDADLDDMANWEVFEEEIIDPIRAAQDAEEGIIEWYDGCFDQSNGHLDSAGDDCPWYEANGDYCGYYDTLDFHANVMCCYCTWYGANQA